MPASTSRCCDVGLSTQENGGLSDQENVGLSTQENGGLSDQENVGLSNQENVVYQIKKMWVPPISILRWGRPPKPALSLRLP